MGEKSETGLEAQIKQAIGQCGTNDNLDNIPEETRPRIKPSEEQKSVPKNYRSGGTDTNVYEGDTAPCSIKRSGHDNKTNKGPPDLYKDPAPHRERERERLEMAKVW